jgi:hypothetical protein
MKTPRSETPALSPFAEGLRRCAEARLDDMTPGQAGRLAPRFLDGLARLEAKERGEEHIPAA